MGYFYRATIPAQQPCIYINYYVLIGIGIPVFDLPFFERAVKHANAVHVEP
jgi:hypothetical protein